MTEEAPPRAQSLREVCHTLRGIGRRLAQHDAQVAETPAGLPCVAFVILMLKRFVERIA
jgi:hypothetical protein